MTQGTRPHFVYRATVFVLRILFKLLFRSGQQGREHLPPKGPFIIAANHASFLDPPILTVTARHCYIRFLARDTLFRHSLANWYLRRGGVIPLHREGGDVKAMKTVLAALGEGHIVALFPEGTRTRDGELQEGKRGIGFLMARARVPVVPAYIDGTFAAFPRGAKFIRFKKTHVSYGAPITPQELADLGPGKAGHIKIAGLVMERIAALKADRP